MRYTLLLLLVTTVVANATVVTRDTPPGRDLDATGFPVNNTNVLKEEKGQSESELRGSSCKPKFACAVLGGHCVDQETPCEGRLVKGGCKPRKCDCCIPGCSEKLGFFSTKGSNQCFKLFRDIPRNWTDSRAKCQAEGLVLAHPSDAVALRSILVQLYGHNSVGWVNARGDGNNTVWQDNGEEITAENPLWYGGWPRSPVGTDQCLRILAHTKWWNDYPTKPYATHPCSWTSWQGQVPYYALCQLKM